MKDESYFCAKCLQILWETVQFLWKSLASNVKATGRSRARSELDQTRTRGMRMFRSPYGTRLGRGTIDPPVNWRANITGCSGDSRSLRVATKPSLWSTIPIVRALATRRHTSHQPWPFIRERRSRRDGLTIARRFQRRVRVPENGTACRRHA